MNHVLSKRPYWHRAIIKTSGQVNVSVASIVHDIVYFQLSIVMYQLPHHLLYATRVKMYIK
jgi:hypothetical protein